MTQDVSPSGDAGPELQTAESREVGRGTKPGPHHPGPIGRHRSGYLPTLDGWRAIACIAVILSHGTPPAYGLVPFGARAVNVFFAISGLLICSRLLGERERWGRISLKSFYIRRAFRIIPPCIFYILMLGALALLEAAPMDRQELISCLLFYRNYLDPSLGHRWTSHLWSLAVEEHFYMIFPCLLVLLGPRRACWWIAGLALCFGLWRVVCDGLSSGGIDTRHTDLCIDRLFWGCWLALLLDLPDWRGRLGRLLTPWSWLGIAGVCIACSVSRAKLGEQSSILQGVLVPLLLAGTVLRPDDLVARIL
jgi:peptidoglycan/LPS O-acetylase OafA/YrhL